MTRIKRRLLIDTSIIGLTMTLFVVALDLTTRIFEPLENWFYDRRAALCQHWTPPPSDKLVHVDIDDAALEAIGRWPWPRSQFAAILDEISLAGAAAIAPDVLFTEPSQRGGGQTDEDAVLAESIARANNVLLPVSLSPGEARPPLLKKLVEYLRSDLALPEQQCAQRLVGDGLLGSGQSFPIDLFIRARSLAASSLILEQLAHSNVTLPELRTRLLPSIDPSIVGSPAIRTLEEEYRKAQAVLPFRRFILRAPPELGKLAEFATEQTPIPQLGAVAVASGYVEYLHGDGGGVVRSMPLLASYGGGLFPQMDLGLACQVLGVDLKSVRISDSQIVIPRPAGRSADIVIPVRERFSPRFNRRIGLVMDIPARGGAEWATLYDQPGRPRSQFHIPAAYVWDISNFRQRMARNNRSIDKALVAVLQEIDPTNLQTYLAQKPGEEDFGRRRLTAEAALKDLHESSHWLLTSMNERDLKPDERRVRDALLDADRDLPRLLTENGKWQKLIQERRGDLRSRIQGKAVLIGSVATGALDKVATAIQPDCPGVVVHGLIYNAVMTGDFWKHAPAWVTALITLLLGACVTMACGLLKPAKAFVAAIVLTAAYLLVNGYLLFDYGNLIVGVAGPVIAMGAVWSTGAVAGFLIESAERARITQRFARYNDPKLVDYMLEHPQVQFDGQVREMSVVFTDLQGFTSLSEQLREQTVPILSNYLSRMVPIIRRHDGLVNKFLGDGIMFFFNAPREDPEHASHAIAACLEMQGEMAHFAEELAKQGLPRLSMRCGVSSGKMVVGDSGPDEASDYTVLGDAVNLAARLEGANKQTGTAILVSQRTVELAGDHYLFMPVGRLQVVGKRQGVMTFEPVVAAKEATPQQRQRIELAGEMIEAYSAGHFARCINLARKLEDQFGPHKLPRLYQKICREYVESPPDEFSGNLVLTEK